MFGFVSSAVVQVDSAPVAAVYTGHFVAILDFKNKLFRRISGTQATIISWES